MTMVKEKIRTTKKQRDRQYIKEELMRYYMYKDKITELKVEIEQFKKEYREILNDPPIGGSIIKMPDGTPNNQNIVMRLESKLNDMESNLLYYKERINTLNKWLGILTEMQYKIAKVYICQYQCQNVHSASLELQYAEDTIKQYTDRITKRIQEKFNKIF